MAQSRSLALALATLVAGILSGSAHAQTKICLIDMTRIFKAHPAFNQKMQALKTEADAFQQKLQQAQQGLVRMNEDLRTLDANSEPFRAKESEIAQASANFELERRNQVRDLMIREARIHFDAYASITALITQYCNEQSVPLVIRFMSDQMKLEDPASIEQGFNNSVVYYEPSRDITDEIIQRITRSSATQQR